MKIPKRFKLMGQTISVVWVEGMGDDTDCAGIASYRHNEIRLQPSTPSALRTESHLEHTFYHELIHWIFFFAGGFYKGDDHLHKNEQLVDMCAGLLHQALATMEYE
jgi:predicted SprT family Zn-dependent metalloprotease